jgi:hypothetical protein
VAPAVAGTARSHSVRRSVVFPVEHDHPVGVPIRGGEQYPAKRNQADQYVGQSDLPRPRWIRVSSFWMV